MMRDARAESDAMSAHRPTEGKILPSTERADYVSGNRDSPVSEDGVRRYDDEISLQRGHMKRGSV